MFRLSNFFVLSVLLASFAAPFVASCAESAHTTPTPQGLCFPLNQKKVTKPLAPLPTDFKKEDNVVSKKGTPSWAEVTGIVDRPILTLYTELLDPKTIRNNNNTQVTVEKLHSKEYLTLLKQTIRVKPIFFLTLDWIESWGFALIKGTPEKPESILISYQKDSGTSHIRTLCGNISLTQLSPTQTGVTLREHLDADNRTPKDIENSLVGTLQTLRKPSKHTP